MKSAFGGKGRKPAPTSAFGAARPRGPRAPSLGAPANPMAGGMPGAAMAPPAMPGAPAFRMGGGVHGGSFATTKSSHDCPTIHAASKMATTRRLCRGGKS